MNVEVPVQILQIMQSLSREELNTTNGYLYQAMQEVEGQRKSLHDLADRLHNLSAFAKRQAGWAAQLTTMDELLHRLRVRVVETGGEHTANGLALA